MQLQPKATLHVLVWSYTALHLLLALLLPLAAHEAHYALYARDPALSYLDHPPLAAWLQSVVLAFTSSDFALRLLPIALSVWGQFLLARLARVVYPHAGRWLEVIAVLLLQGALVFHGSMTLSPDVPLLPLALLVVLVTVPCLEADRWRDWLLLGLVIGLAGLAKYTAVTLAFSVVVAVVLHRGWRGLFSPRMWLTGLVALAMISPVLLWNFRHDWLTVAFHADYQFEDVARWSASGLLQSSAAQLAYYSPLVVIGGAAVLGGWLRRPTEGRSRVTLLPVFVIPVLLVYLVTALESRASPHWSMLGWLFVIPMLAAWLSERWRSSRPLRLLGWISGGYSVLSLVLIVVLALPLGTWPEYTHPARSLAGWEAAATRGDALRRTLDPQGFTAEPALLVRNWHHAGLLGWYAPGVPVRNLFADLNPYNLKHGPPDHRTWGVLVYPRRTDDPHHPNLTRDYACTPIDAMPAQFGSSLVQTFHFYACYSKLPPS